MELKNDAPCRSVGVRRRVSTTFWAPETKSAWEPFDAPRVLDLIVALGQKFTLDPPNLPSHHPVLAQSGSKEARSYRASSVRVFVVTSIEKRGVVSRRL